MADLTTDIETNAQGPAAASGDSVSVTQHNLKDQIAADKYLKNNTAVSTNPRFGLRFAKLSPPGAV